MRTNRSREKLGQGGFSIKPAVLLSFYNLVLITYIYCLMIMISYLLIVTYQHYIHVVFQKVFTKINNLFLPDRTGS
jgi:hypothetical protein